MNQVTTFKRRILYSQPTEDNVCPIHPRYKAIRPPQGCPTCWEKYAKMHGPESTLEVKPKPRRRVSFRAK